MSSQFDTIEYLQAGNPKQRLAYEILKQSQILGKLSKYDPLLAGTIPIGIDIESSDLDIICYCREEEAFVKTIRQHFGGAAGLELRFPEIRGKRCVVAQFQLAPFTVEVFGQDTPSRQQLAYRHMLIEHRLLQEHGEAFRQQIIALKKQGYKTEPAFAKALSLKGDPYLALLRV